MKKSLLCFCTILISLSASAQIPNAGFETWFNAGSFEDAQGWASFNPYTQFASTYTVSKTTDSHSGMYAALVETKSFFNTLSGMQDTVAGYMITGTDVFAADPGFGYTLRPDSLNAFYKYTAAGSDVAAIGVSLTKWNGAAGARDFIAYAEISITASAASYTAGSAALIYLLPDFPDTATILITSSNGSIAFPGSALKVDDISLVTITGIEKLKTNQMDVIAFPNPAKENIRFQFAAASSFMISIVDITGRIISTFHTDGKNFADTDVRNYHAGLYFYVVKEKSGNAQASGKFCVLR